MVLGDVEEKVTTVEIVEETQEGLIKVLLRLNYSRTQPCSSPFSINNFPASNSYRRTHERYPCFLFEVTV
jgi:hypothetical protein